MTLLDLVTIVGACAAVVGTFYTILNSKRCILRRIDKKVGQIGQIDYLLALKYGINRGRGGPLTKLDIKKAKLENQINELKRYL